MKIETPSGYTVTLKQSEDLNFGETRQIQKAMVKNMKIKAGQSSENISLSGADIYDAQDEILKIIIKKIEDKDGRIIGGDLFKEVMSWKAEDAEPLYEVVNSVLNSDKKN